MGWSEDQHNETLKILREIAEDKAKARCGGPARCKACAAEIERTDRARQNEK